MIIINTFNRAQCSLYVTQRNLNPNSRKLRVKDLVILLNIDFKSIKSFTSRELRCFNTNKMVKGPNSVMPTVQKMMQIVGECTLHEIIQQWVPEDGSVQVTAMHCLVGEHAEEETHIVDRWAAATKCFQANKQKRTDSTFHI